MNRLEYIAVASRFLVGVVFVVAALGKLAGAANFEAFVQSVRGLRLLPPGWAIAVARVIIGAELTVVALLAIPYSDTAVAGFGLSAALSTVFAIAIAAAVRRGVTAPCRCFGASRAPLGPVHIVRNALLTAVSALGAIGSIGGTPTLAGAAVAAFAGLVLGALTIALDDLVNLFRPVRTPS